MCNFGRRQWRPPVAVVEKELSEAVYGDKGKAFFAAGDDCAEYALL